MKKILIPPCLLLLIAGAVVAQESQTTWQRYTVKGEEFSINLPTLPAMTTSHQVPERPQMREIWERRLGAYANGVVYTIYSLNDGNPKKALKNGVEGISSYVRWELNTAQNVTCDGFTGRQYVSTHELGGTIQLFATDTHYYRFQAVGAPVDDPRVQQFFSSLSLGKNSDGIEVTDGPGSQPADETNNQEGSAVYPGKTVDRKVIIVMKIEPTYTEEARNNKITGTVVLRAVFSSKGSVTNIQTISALPFGMTEQAIDALKKTRFIPAVKDGKLVSMWMQLEYNFSLF